MDSKKIPEFIYGTAWKEEKTESLTYKALEAGFLAIDTANQRKHYFEEGVGLGIKKFLNDHKKKRDDIFIQTKFTFARGQDHRKPYDEKASYTLQVKQSFESSLQHLQTDFLDSYLLHGPFTNDELTTEDWETWAAIEDIYTSGRTKFIGVSNFNLFQLQDLCAKAKTKPHFIQNRCFALMAWDKDIRDFCREAKIYYQGFSLLTANMRELSHPNIIHIARKYQKPLPQIVFKFSQQIGMIPITGTTNSQNMKMDLDIKNFELTPQELATIEACSIM